MINTYEIRIIKADLTRITETYRIGGNKEKKQSQLNAIIDTHGLLGNTVMNIEVVNQED
ncbi:hypothetical protein [Vibrio sp. WXL210]|uniref:hypothetical protein n=1 Tax=Vibrio sp. WXL210 TaxID=3450709 RepID=UPI003EC88170